MKNKALTWIITLGSLLLIGNAIASNNTASPAPQVQESPAPTPKIETKTETVEEPINFVTKEVGDPTQYVGQSKTTQEGVSGRHIKTYTVTYTDGKETGRVLTKDETINPTDKIVAKGTKQYAIAPPIPAGATARCRDGSYSYSQHRQGTCSWHGGVAEWL